MATIDQNNTNTNNSVLNGNPSSESHDFEKATRGMSHEEKHAAQNAARFGYGPLAHMRTNNEATLPGKSIFSQDTATRQALTSG